MGPHYVNVILQNISVSRFLVGQKIVQSYKTRQENSKDCDIGRAGKELLIQIRFSHGVSPLPANKYMLKVNHENDRKV